MRTLSQRELNRTLLQRQLLLQRSRTPIPRTLERMGGLQAQYAPAMYIGLWSRMENLRREQVTRALERRSVVQATLMRTTIHLVSARDYWPLELGVRAGRREAWGRSQHSARRDYDPAAWDAAAACLRDRLRADGPLRRGEVEQLIGREYARGIHAVLPLVRVPPSGTWERRRADLYGDPEAWLGRPPDRLTPEDGLALLARRYLAAFGPSTSAEIAAFAGLRPAEVAPALEALTLRRFRAEDGADLLDLPRLPIADAETPAPVRFLPVWDATLLVHARRTQILPEEHRARIFSPKHPQSFNTFLVDGAVAGTWRFADGRVELEPFRRFDSATRRALRAEGERLAAFLA
jgi:winged helix DNA-binding protein